MKAAQLFLLFVLLACAFDALAGPSINGNDPQYSGLPLLQGTDVQTDFEVRMAIGSQVAGVYRLANGQSTLPIGSTFTLVYKDGSKEQFLVTSKTGSMGAAPIPGTQKDANGNVIPNGAGGSVNYRWLFSSGIWSFFGPSGCIGNCSGTVTVYPVRPQ